MSPVYTCLALVTFCHVTPFSHEQGRITEYHSFNGSVYSLAQLIANR